MILAKLKNWSIERIFKIDLAILRLAVYEIAFTNGIPPKVAVNEAVELAKKYGNDSTKIIVAQRIGTIRYADKIVVLNNGKIEGYDTHNNLLDNCSLYRSMAEAQLRKEELYNA